MKNLNSVKLLTNPIYSAHVCLVVFGNWCFDDRAPTFVSFTSVYQYWIIIAWQHIYNFLFVARSVLVCMMLENNQLVVNIILGFVKDSDTSFLLFIHNFFNVELSIHWNCSIQVWLSTLQKSWQGQCWSINFQYRVNDLYQEIEPSILPSIRLKALMNFHHHRSKLKIRVIYHQKWSTYIAWC